MIRSSRLTSKYANAGKRDDMRSFIAEYRRVCQVFVNILWDTKDVPKLLNKDFTDRFKGTTWLSARAIQCCGKQASGIVRGTRKKHEQRLWRLREDRKRGKKNARLIKALGSAPSKPNLSNLSPELDSRFVKVAFKSENSFDGWVTLSSLGRKIKIAVPVKRHEQFNKWDALGKRTDGLRLSEKELTFMFEVERVKKTTGNVLGVDIGITSAVTGSDGTLTSIDNHGHSLTSILKKIVRCEKGSKCYSRACRHRNNYVNWSINRLNLDGVKEVRRENIKNLRLGKRTSKVMRAWTYPYMFDKLERRCEERGVRVSVVNPAHTSQTCSRCGTLGERERKSFACQCGFRADADINAALNLAGEFIVPREKGRKKFPRKP